MFPSHSLSSWVYRPTTPDENRLNIHLKILNILIRVVYSSQLKNGICKPNLKKKRILDVKLQINLPLEQYMWIYGWSATASKMLDQSDAWTNESERSMKKNSADT